MATTNTLLNPEDSPVWFITGCSTGFGRELASHVLGLGYRTVVSVGSLLLSLVVVE
jgi:NAD(P)-dependent dehydrogenase (short-subunit alcohol dehydrogenase family)